MDITSCPECGSVAEVLWRTELESTDGLVEHAKVLCLNRHGFLLPTAALPAAAETAHGLEDRPGVEPRPDHGGEADDHRYEREQVARATLEGQRESRDSQPRDGQDESLAPHRRCA